MVERTDLVARLESCGDASVLSISAPAGYGKSTAIAQLAAAQTRPCVWLDLEDLDNDPVYFLRRFLGALSEVEPIHGPMGEFLRGRSPMLTTVMVPHLRRELARRDVATLVVLDDLHLVRAPATIECVQAIVANVDPGSQVVVSSRGAPDLAFGRMRLDRDVVEFGPEDLKMTLAEAGELLRAVDAEVTEEQVRQILTRSEGWPAGLGLAALTLTTRGGRDRAVESFAGDHRFVAEYVREELLRELPDELAEFSLHSSVLTRMSGPRCDAVLQRGGSGALLDDLARSRNLFVVPLDDTRTWYRFHHLFRDVLLAELTRTSPELAAQLQARASIVCAEEGDVDGAIRHALAADDVDRAASLVLAHVLAFASRGLNATVGLWLELFSDIHIKSSACLALAKAWYLVGAADADVLVIEHWIAVAESQQESGPLADGSPSVEVAGALLRALTGLGGVNQVRADADRVRSVCDRSSPWWGTATFLAGVARSLAGDTGDGRRLLNEALASQAVVAPVRATCLAQLAVIEASEGNWSAVTLLSRRALDVVEANDLHEYGPIALVYAIEGLAAAKRNEAAVALGCVRHGHRLIRSLTHTAPRTHLLVHMTLAAAQLRLGDPVAAEVLITEAERRRAEEPDATLLLAWLDELHRRCVAASRVVGAREQLGPSSLSMAELRVLEYLPTHYSYAEIAAQLYVSRNTVKTQAISIFRKLGVSSRTDAVARAADNGLLV
jgi:LuxR family maltose regulon positive regulatory protein